MRLLLCHLLLVSFFLAAPYSECHSAQSGMFITDDIQLKLGDAFAADGDYYRAITEYRKLLILFADSPKADTAMFNIGMAYYNGEEYESAVKAFAALRTRYPQSLHARKAAYHQGLCLVNLKQPEKATEAFAAATVPVQDKSEEVRAASFGLAIAAFDRNDLAESRSALERFVSQNPQDSGVPKAREAMDLLDRSSDPQLKSPLLAGAMSAVIPGSGQFYTGRYGDAFTSLLLNGLFIAGTVVAAQNENYALAGVTGLIGLPFYVGNIYGGANAANKWNLGIKKDLRGKLALILEYPF